MTRIDRTRLAESTRQSLTASARMFKVAGLSAHCARAESIRIEREFYQNARKAHRIETSATVRKYLRYHAVSSLEALRQLEATL